MTRPGLLTSLEAKAKILVILDEGIVILTHHCRSESMRKRDVDMNDVRLALLNGEIRRTPEWSDEYQNWKYRVEGFDILGDELTCITVIIDAELTALIVTVF
ncbi:MAG: DUF4258 domain-containing protein [Acidobacteriota bacterium]